MEEFYKTFKPVIRIANNGGIYIPNCEVIYTRGGNIIKILVHINLFLSMIDFIILSSKLLVHHLLLETY